MAPHEICMNDQPGGIFYGKMHWKVTTINLGNLPFSRAKTAVKCILVGQLTGPMTIGSTLLQKAKVTDHFRRGKPDTPQEKIEVASLDFSLF